jgi:hypothetical protein
VWNTVADYGSRGKPAGTTAAQIMKSTRFPETRSNNAEAMQLWRASKLPVCATSADRARSSRDKGRGVGGMQDQIAYTWRALRLKQRASVWRINFLFLFCYANSFLDVVNKLERNRTFICYKCVLRSERLVCLTSLCCCIRCVASHEWLLRKPKLV